MRFLKKIPLFEKALLFLFLALGSFLRFYRLRTLMIYLGDEGRDMMIVKDILDGVNFPLIGPPTSVGKLFLGPIYYYFIAPFVWLFRMDPVGPAVFVALLSVLTIPLIYLTGKNFFNNKTGLFAVSLYTTSPLIVEFSRSSWNPNPMPFFTLLLMLGLFYWQKTKKAKFLYLAVVSFGIMLQLHYMPILMTPFLFFIIYYLGKKAKNKKQFLFSFLILVFLLSPLFLFDLRHNFCNTKGLLDIIKDRSGQGFNLFDLLSRTRDRLRHLFSMLLNFSEREWKTNLIVLAVLFFSTIDWFKQKNVTRIVVYGWIIWGFLAVGLYRSSVYPHYLGFLFPFPFLLLGNILKIIFDKKIWTNFLSLILFFSLFIPMVKKTWGNVTRDPVLNVDLIIKTSRLIDEKRGGKKFNFALLADNNYDDSYRYFFKLWDLPVVYKTEVSEQLFVVCEGEKPCQPQGNPKWEIAFFDAHNEGYIDVAGFWQTDPLVKVYRLIPKTL